MRAGGKAARNLRVDKGFTPQVTALVQVPLRGLRFFQFTGNGSMVFKGRGTGAPMATTNKSVVLPLRTEKTRPAPYSLPSIRAE